MNAPETPKDKDMTALYILTGINTVLACTTLGVLIFGAKKVEQEVEDAKSTATDNFESAKQAVVTAISGLSLKL